MTVKNYGLVESEDKLEKFVDRLIEEDKPISFDIETGYLGPIREKAALHPEEAFIVGISFTNSTNWARYVPLRHELTHNFDPVFTAKQFWRLLATGNSVCHNHKFEARFMARFFREYLSDDPDCGKDVQISNGYYPIRSDTLIEAYVVAEQKLMGLKSLAKELFGHQMTEIKDLFVIPGSKKPVPLKSIRFNSLDLSPKVINYVCEDSVWCLAIHNKYYPRVKDNPIYNLEMKILPVLCEMEEFGVKFDWNQTRRGTASGKIFFEKMKAEIQAELSAMTGEDLDINLGSPAQLSTVLYGKLGMSTSRFTKSTRNLPESQKKMATDAIALKGLSEKYPIVKKILHYKEMKVLLTRYLEKYEKDFSYASDGMTHPNHAQARVPTGRFAVDSPAYQQMPKKYHYELNDGTAFDFKFRDIIIAPKDHYILGFDYKQIELRVVAGEAREPALLAAFNNNEDPHTTTAALMLGIPKEQVTEELRNIGKMLNFALLYGLSPKSLAERLAISKDDAVALFNQYFQTYSAIKVWTERQVAQGKKDLFVKTRFGRKVPIREFESKDVWIYQHGERLAVNAPVQGSAGDYVKMAMVRQHQALKSAGLLDRVHLSMNIHDALEYCVHKTVPWQRVIDTITPAIIFPVDGWPKLEVDWHVGKKWGSLRDLEIGPDGKARLVGGPVREEENVSAPADDEEDGEGTEDLPNVDLSVLKEVIHVKKPESIEIAAPVPDTKVESFDDSPGKTVYVEITGSLEKHRYLKFIDLLTSRPGNNVVVLKTPEGDMDLAEVGHCTGTSIGPAQQAEVSMALNGALVTYAPDSVDVDELVGDIEF